MLVRRAVSGLVGFSVPAGSRRGHGPAAIEDAGCVNYRAYDNTGPTPGGWVRGVREFAGSLTTVADIGAFFRVLAGPPC